MPPVALTTASVPAPLSSRVAPAIASCPVAEAAPVPVALPALAPADPPVAPARRPRLRLVTSADPTAETAAAEVLEVHGHGGPSSCRCRPCVMARHPASASLPRLTVVR